MRWTMPGRSRPPMPESVPPQWCSSALTSVPSGAPGRGMHHEPRRLVDDDEVGVLVDDVERDRLGSRLDRPRRRQADDDLGAGRELQPRVAEDSARRRR